jgi:glycerol-3-phosphate dehydrogenase (NAD(P)+)
MASFHSVAVIGGGAYGTALACAALRAGRDVVLYARSTEAVAQMQTTRENPKLPGVSLDAGIDVTSDMAMAGRAEFILLATPAQSLREAATSLAPHLRPEACDTRRRLRQGNRARYPSLHDRDHRRDHTAGDPCDPVGTEFR